MAQTCENCYKGVLAIGTPTGKVSKFGGVDTYFAGSSANKKSAIVIATDVFGYSFVNNQLLADTFAKHTGLLTVVPDLFNNDPMRLDAHSLPAEERDKYRAEWRPKHFPPESKMPILHAVFKELKEKEGIEKIAVAGYCFGGRIATLLASTDYIQIAIVAHPSGLKVPEEIETIKIPTLWLCAETDQTFPQEARKQTQEVLQKKGVKNVFKDYPGTEHGFAVRGDEKSEHVYKAKIDAAEQVIKFVNEEF